MDNKYSDHDLNRLRESIEQFLSWGKASSWHSKMYNELSEKVFESTQILLSVPTLKRFFGVVNHEGTPSITTLDALSQFVGKGNWREFKLSGKSAYRKSSNDARRSTYVTIGFVLALMTIGLIGNKRPDVIIDSAEFSFSSKVLSREFPNSVVFDFEVPKTLRADSLRIQQYWDPTKTISVAKEQTQATGIYYFPGYFRAKLLADKEVAKEHDLFLKSEGWLGTTDYQPVPKYFNPLIGASSVAFPPEILREVTSLNDPVSSTLHYVDNLGNISGDHCILKATIKNTFEDRWAVCQTVNIYLLGTSGAMIIPFSKIGCTSDNNLMLNDVYLRGKEHDLSSLSADFKHPVELEVRIEQMNVQVRVNQKDVYSHSYGRSMGRLVGVRFKFLGLGEVINYEVRDQSMNLIGFNVNQLE